MGKSFKTNTLDVESTDKLFCVVGKKWGVKKLMLKAIAITESSLNERAYRYEPGYWQRYGERVVEKYPFLKGCDISKWSASYGLFQLMAPTALDLGWTGDPEELYDPTINANLGAKLMSQLVARIRKSGITTTFPFLSEWECACSIYNGGAYKNPCDKGILRNQKYADKVLFTFYELKKKERDCSEGE
jgi:soluble lytic murein transglycosylase-like protein